MRRAGDTATATMIFKKTRIQGVYLLELERITDERGFFARLWCQTEFSNHGIDSRLVQCNLSFNPRQGTLRGMHYQLPPHEETKVVRCTTGAVFDVAVDLRRDSLTFRQWVGAPLTAENREMLVIPPGCAHGYLTLTDNAEVSYQMSEYYAPQHGTGVRWNDPAFNIQWPGDVKVIADRDRTYPNFNP
jgi:dTDP-4-dehydrorhamnose 3,5-epimerase